MTYTVAHVWHGNIFRLSDHVDRLLDGARKLRLESPLSKAELEEITKQCVSLSQLRESYVNLTITRGFGRRKGEKDLSKLTARCMRMRFPTCGHSLRTSRSSAPLRSCRATSGGRDSTRSTRP